MGAKDFEIQAQQALDERQIDSEKRVGIGKDRMDRLEKAVTTNLPLTPDKPISFGVHSFCMACESCAEYCPPGAVPRGTPTDRMPNPFHNNPGFRKWWIDAEKCIIFWGLNKKKWPSCGGRCIAVCPWNKPIIGFHNAVRWLAVCAPDFIKKLLVRGDRIVYRRKKRINP